MFKIERTLVLALSMALIASCASKPQSSAPPEQTTAPVNSNKKEATQPVDRNDFSCTKDRDHRTLYIVKTIPNGCKIWYSNFSKSKPVASAHMGTEYCIKVYEKIQKNLTQAGFVCEQVK